MGLRYYLNDTYSMQKAIWVIDKKHIDISEEDVATKLEICTKGRGKKRKLNTVKENSAERRLQKKGRCSIRSPSRHAKVEGLHIIPWQLPTRTFPLTKSNENTCNYAKDLDQYYIPAQGGSTPSKNDQGDSVNDSVNTASVALSLTFSQSTSPLESLEKLIDPQLLDIDLEIKAIY